MIQAKQTVVAVEISKDGAIGQKEIQAIGRVVENMLPELSTVKSFDTKVTYW